MSAYPRCATLLTVKELRFGVHALAPSNHDDWVTLCREIERLGFSILTVPDHLIDGCISPFASLGVAAEATSILRVGTLVLNNELRHPAIVAREALALDALSGGRVEVGLGAGSEMSAAEHESIGLPFDDALTRVSRLAEAVEVMDRLLRGGSVTFAGNHYRLVDHRSWPPPTQQPRPPIVVGGSGPMLLRVAAQCADIVSLSGLGKNRADKGHGTSGLSPRAVDERVALIRAASAGRHIELQALVQRVIVTDDARAAARQVQERLPELSVDEVLASPYLWIGSVESIGDDILAAGERWGFSYFTVFQDSVGAVEPIIKRVAGARA
jgi:probable F420-dependent oxidoreductase